jgi:regulator of sigma E protease
MLNILISIIGVLITIFLVVGIHELGHFLVAKSLGIKVLRFSIGFGKALFTCHDKKGTEYVLAAIPLGGYVKMLDEGEGPVSPDELPQTFNRQPIYKKVAVIAAGPVFNLIFAFFIYWVLFTVGFVSIAPIIGEVDNGSIAQTAGLKSQQEILKIDDRKITSWTSVVITLLLHAGDDKALTMELKNPDGRVQLATMDLTHWHLNKLKPDPLNSLGINPYEPEVPAIIGNELPNSPAAQSGLKTGDKIIAIDSKPIKDWYEVVELTYLHPDEIFSFQIERGKDKEKLSLPVRVGHKRNLFFQKSGFLGMGPAFEWPKELLRHNKYGPINALQHAWQDVVLFSDMNFIILGKMFTGKISLQSLGGPITIFQSAGTALNNGLMAFASFLAFLSISIGIINIVPIPGLDGGHLLFQLIEFVIRRPLSEKTLGLFYRLGMIFLLLIMVQALVNDMLRL